MALCRHPLAEGRLIRHSVDRNGAHDCPVAECLIRTIKTAKRMLGDKAYDSAELRGEPMNAEKTNHSKPQQQGFLETTWPLSV
jgi:hypothetical protein